MRNNGNRWAHRTFEDAAKAQAKREADVLAAQLRRSLPGRAPRMTRCYYSFIASVIASLTSEREQVARAFADRLAATNDRFDHARFLRACGVQS